jgi:hypothetical protein
LDWDGQRDATSTRAATRMPRAPVGLPLSMGLPAQADGGTRTPDPIITSVSHDAPSHRRPVSIEVLAAPRDRSRPPGHFGGRQMDATPNSSASRGSGAPLQSRSSRSGSRSLAAVAPDPDVAPGLSAASDSNLTRHTLTRPSTSCIGGSRSPLFPWIPWSWDFSEAAERTVASPHWGDASHRPSHRPTHQSCASALNLDDGGRLVVVRRCGLLSPQLLHHA